MNEEPLESLNKEGLSLPDDANWDQSKRATAVLENILSTEQLTSSTNEVSAGDEIAVTEALHSRPVLNLGTGRGRARVLFVTTNEGVLAQNSLYRQQYIKLAEQFDEVHVICLVNRKGESSFDRASDNTWFYKVHYRGMWEIKSTIKQAASEALVWNNDFRPDVVVGIDPFEAGWGAYVIAQKFKRPLQLHVSTNHLVPNFRQKAPDNRWRYRTARYLYKRSPSVRTHTNHLKNALEKKYKTLLDVALLPRFYDFAGLFNAQPVLNLREKYPDFAFVMITFGPLTADSHLHNVFTALHRMLRNPRIGLIVIGDGPAEELFKEKIKLLGIEKSVVFKKTPEDLVSYYKTANALIEANTSEEGEVHVLKAAAAELPIVAVATDLRRDLFVDGESALLSESGDLLTLTDNVSQLINNVAVRKRLVGAARVVAESRIHEDPNTHYQALAATIESVLVS